MAISARRRNTCIVVADGARARIFIDPGGGGGLHPVLLDSLEGDKRPTREIGSDRPGRTFESADTSRHGYAPRVDWHTFEKHLFARRVAELVDQAHRLHAFDELVLVAPPKTLGELRSALGKESKRHIRAEFDKDLTGLDEHELVPRLTALLAE
jgi:protein required for attachment to host cells